MICIIVPVFNVKNYLDRCVNSILNQTITNFELVLVDDGSTDGSGKICDDYNCIDKRVKVFHQKNSGQSKARNIGIDYAFSNQKIEYITFIDSDDCITPSSF